MHRWPLVVLHPHHDLVLHGQPGRLPHHREARHADILGGRPRVPEQDQVGSLASLAKTSHPWDDSGHLVILGRLRPPAHPLDDPGHLLIPG